MRTPTSPLRAHGPDVLDWEQVDPRERAHGRDTLGLTQADRHALGLTPVRSNELVAPNNTGSAEAALADALERNGKRAPRRRS